MAFTDVYDGSEIVVEIGEFDTDWNYTTISYRRGLTIDRPDNTRNVYDRLSFKGKKLTRSEKTLSVSQEFQGFEEGLANFEQTDGLLVKITITPHDGSTPTTPEMYFTNWSTIPMSFDDLPDEGEVNVTLEGTFDEMVSTEPADDSGF